MVYSSDKTGIFNIYRLNLGSKESVQLTNVLGGAFMPAVNAAGQLAFASYTSSGYKIALMNEARQLQNMPVYARSAEQRGESVVKLTSASDGSQFDWQSLR